MKSPASSTLKGRSARPRQRGLSLVEMMVGITVGLFIVAAASMMVAMQLGENRRLLLETQVQQDLRATADIMTRELRRSGHWFAAQQSVWYPAAPTAVRANPLTGLAFASSTEMRYSYDRDPDTAGPYGFKIQGGRISTLLGNGWQELTDGNVLEITGLTITERNSAGALLPCPRECTGAAAVDGPTGCWPRLIVRELTITITGEAVSDPRVNRTVTSIVRLRNDLVRFTNPASPADICPA